ncbi:hypothetical protein [Flavobacterium gyeonganense]|uniref:YceI-like domain-containing protein n=1 Tax=Flavobacterium gyeonganense TaxID=1310418 RepID=A0ABV5HF10_9FLAO|nr:hypothetical protein [Flavobacterium gyeonganense]
MGKKKQSIWGYVIGGLTLMGLMLGIITDGFQAWDFFTTEKKIENPAIIDFRLEPIVVDISDSDFDYKSVQTELNIESTNGTYYILDSLRILNFTVTDSTFFVKNFEIKSKIKNIDLDKRIMDIKNPSQTGRIMIENDFILDGQSLGDIIMSHSEKEIAQYTIRIPYIFNNNVKLKDISIPLIVKSN